MHNHHVIIGGMGPQASIRLHELLLQFAGEGRTMGPSDYPTILHASLSVPDFIADRSAESGAVRVINDAAEQLPLESALSVGMACNTAHLLRERLSFPRHNFVSMIQAVVNEIQTLHASRVGLLASPTTIRSQLYRNALGEAGIETIEPTGGELKLLDEIIHGVIAGKDPAALRPALSGIAARHQQDGAAVILLGCTELPLIGVDSSVPVVDSLSALAHAMLEKSGKLAVARV